jgi:hypothetical protein
LLLQAGVYLPNTCAKEQLNIAVASRHVLETTARRLVEGNERIDIQYGAAVSGLMFDSTPGANGSKPAAAAVTGKQPLPGQAPSYPHCCSQMNAVLDWCLWHLLH